MSLLNRRLCKLFILECAQNTRGGKFTRVSADVFPWLENILQERMRGLVHAHPSVGKTVYSPHKAAKGADSADE